MVMNIKKNNMFILMVLLFKLLYHIIMNNIKKYYNSGTIKKWLVCKLLIKKLK